MLNRSVNLVWNKIYWQKGNLFWHNWMIVTPQGFELLIFIQKRWDILSQKIYHNEILVILFCSFSGSTDFFVPLNLPLYSWTCLILFISTNCHGKKTFSLSTIAQLLQFQINVSSWSNSELQWVTEIHIYSWQHINKSKVLHTYVMNKFLTASCLNLTRCFWKKNSKDL